ncbi:MAG TPA: DUF2062 domain-containing protein [Burkholderiales bacterium]|nr:DUF2062 domain-containing protein [Burkholderiales bacterium]
MPRKYFRKYLPDAAQLRSHRMLRMFGSLLQHPNLWHLNRESVAGGVAIGLFAGLVPGPFQMLVAALLAVPLHRNLPVALLTTLYTNPFTIVPLYVLAYEYGKLLLGAGGGAPSAGPPELDWTQLGASLRTLVHWSLSLGKPLALGLFALACTLAALGYFGVHLAWRAYVVLAWRARRRARRKGPRR